jgi:hypothetical protein
MADDEPEEVVATEEEPAAEAGAAEVEIEMSVLDALKEVRFFRSCVVPVRILVLPWTSYDAVSLEFLFEA